MSFSDWILARGDALQAPVFFSLLAMLLAAERLWPRRGPGSDRAARWRANGVLTALSIASLAVAPVGFVGAAVWAKERGVGLLNQASLPLAVVVVASLLGRAFVSFSTHWTMHRVPLLWRIHRVHHLDTDLDVTSTVRFHPLEMLVALPAGIAMVIAFGIEPWVLAVYEMLDVSVTLFSHANLHVPAMLDRWLRYLVVTPDLHRVHHSTWRPETDSNFGAVFPIWDVVFGTFRTGTREPHETMRLGLEEVRGRRAHDPLWLVTSIVHARVGDGDSTVRSPAHT